MNCAGQVYYGSILHIRFSFLFGILALWVLNANIQSVSDANKSVEQILESKQKLIFL